MMFFAGILAGVITGITPGLHANLAATIVVSLGLPGLPLFLLGMAITHTFLDILPTTYLSVPSADRVMLASQHLVHAGRGHEAVKLATLGSLLCLLIGIALTPLFIIIFPKMSTLLGPWLGWILLGIVALMIWREPSMNQKFWAMITFVAAGLLGIITLDNVHEPLLPLLSSLFGTSTILMNLLSKSDSPAQRVTDEYRANTKETIHASFGGTLAGAFIALFPGLGPAQAGVMASNLFPTSPLASIILTGGINTANMLISLVTMLTLGKARNGVMVTLLEQMQRFRMAHLLLFLAGSLVAAGIAVLLTLFLSRIFCKVINKINERVVYATMLVFVTLLVAYFSGGRGLIVLLIGTSIGLLPNVMECQKSHAMGCVLMPVMVFLLL